MNVPIEVLGGFASLASLIVGSWVHQDRRITRIETKLDDLNRNGVGARITAVEKDVAGLKALAERRGEV